jgi:hypothetical protein
MGSFSYIKLPENATTLVAGHVIAKAVTWLLPAVAVMVQYKIRSI